MSKAETPAQKFISEAITEQWGDRCPDFDTDCACCQTWAEYDRIYLHPPVQVPVVKALEWVEQISGEWWIADRYRVEKFDGGGFAARSKGPRSGALKTLRFGVSFDEAKAAAQSDYETRILSALSTQAVDGKGETETQKTAAKAFGDWLNDGPRLAKAAGLYVGIKVSAAPFPASPEQGEKE